LRKDFKTFLLEEANKPNKINDVADHFLDGHDAVQAVAKNMENLHNHLLGKNQSIDYHTHYQGTPIEFGNDKTGRFYVSHAGGKPNYHLSDVLKNHKDDPETQEVMNSALEHLPKIMSRKGGVYKGNVIHTKGNRSIKNDQIHLHNDDITYSTHKDSPEGRRIRNSSIGITVHTNVSKNKPITPKDMESFQKHPDVHIMDTRINPNPKHYSSKDQKEFLTKFGLATNAYKSAHENIFDDLAGHSKHIRNYISNARANGENPSVDGFISHAQEVSPNLLQGSVNLKHHLKKVFDMHNNLHDAKNILLNVAHKNEPYVHTQEGETVDPKRIISVDKQGKMVKFERFNNSTQIREETTSGGDAVRGFGDVSGNPAVDEDPMQQYITTNMLAKDKENGALMKMMKHTQTNLLGFKQFNPMTRSGSMEYFDDDENHNLLLRDKARNAGKRNNVTRG